MRLAGLVVLVVGCGRISFDATLDGRDDQLDAFDRCAAERTDLGSWGAPVRITAASSVDAEDDPVMSHDGLELYFISRRAGGPGDADVYRLVRPSRDADWQPVELLAALSSPEYDNTLELASDDLELWLVSDRPGGVGGEDIWTARRASRDAAWSTPTLVTQLSSTALDRAPAVFDDDRSMLFHSTRDGSTRFYVSTRADRDSDWTTPQPFDLDAADGDAFRGWMSPCGLELTFQAARGATDLDFYRTRRTSRDAVFAPAMLVGELSSSAYDQDLQISDDGRHAIFSSQRDPDFKDELYEAFR